MFNPECNSSLVTSIPSPMGISLFTIHKYPAYLYTTDGYLDTPDARLS